MQTIKVALICFTLISAMHATDMRYSTIDVPNSTSTFALGINARGDIVGQYDDRNGVTHGFLLRKGLFSTIDFPRASSTLARAINARGDIVGTSTDVAGVNHG